MTVPVGTANLIKQQILVVLNTLKSNGVISQIIEADINESILDMDIPGYPCVFLGQSRMNAAWEYQQSNRRTYTFDIMVMQLQDNLTSMGDIEDLRDAVAFEFDNNLTLAGTAVAGVQAAYSERMPSVQKGKNLVVFYVTITATTLEYMR